MRIRIRARPPSLMKSVDSGGAISFLISCSLLRHSGEVCHATPARNSFSSLSALEWDLRSIPIHLS